MLYGIHPIKNIVLKKFIINSLNHQNIRLDKWLKQNFSSLNQSFIEKNLRKKNITVNDNKASSKYNLQKNDFVKIYNFSEDTYSNLPKKTVVNIIPSKYIKLFNSSIIFENPNFIILNKWTGIATQGGSKINISIDHIIKSISSSYNLVHRLDRETSGILVIAKDLESTKYFGKLFRDHLINKIYIAICQGVPKNNESEINLSITDKRDIKKKHNTLTKYKLFQSKNKLSTIIFSPKTGKTHQIRIVAQHLSCPIIGDTKYNKQSNYGIEKLKLNAHMISFLFKNKEYNFISNLPEHFKFFLKKNNLKNLSPEMLNNFL